MNAEHEKAVLEIKLRFMQQHEGRSQYLKSQYDRCMAESSKELAVKLAVMDANVVCDNWIYYPSSVDLIAFNWQKLPADYVGHFPEFSQLTGDEIEAIKKAVLAKFPNMTFEDRTTKP